MSSYLLRACILGALALTPALSFAAQPATAPPAALVEDVATTGTFEYRPPHDGYYFVEMAGRLYFAADDGIHGRELWTSDGTEAGTRLVADICPGYCSGGITSLTVAGDRLYFVADDEAHGREPWTSDGTAADTRLVADIAPGLTSSATAWMTADGTGVWFAADDGVHGLELWHSDGTAGGTAMVADIFPAMGSSSPDRLTLLPSGLFFSADDGTQGREPWLSDGTPGGTVPLADVKAGPEDGMRSFPPAVLASSRDWTRFDGRIVFAADDAIHGREPWVTDGTPGGTRLLADVDPTRSVSVRAFTEFDGRLYFRVSSVSEGGQLWSTDAIADTSLVVDPADGGFTAPLGVAGGRLFLRLSTPATGTELWATDGTAAGTVAVADIHPGSEDGISAFASFVQSAPLGDSLVFAADDGTSGLEPWISDGTAEGTRLLRDLGDGETLSLPAFSISTTILPFADQVVFWGLAGDSVEPWISDGTEVGTRPLADLNQQASALTHCIVFHCPQRPAGIDGRLYLQLRDGVAGAEPWVSRGSAGTTERVADVEPAIQRGFPVPSSPFFFVAAGQNVVFDASRVTGGRRLYAARSQRTPRGAWFPTTVEQVGDATDPQPAISAFGLAFFQGYDSAGGEELWKSDGSDEGTERVIDLRPGPDGSGPHSLTPFGDELFFAAAEDASGEELYATNGSSPGTRRVGDLVPGPDSSAPRALAASGEFLFFSAETAATGRELWVSDGSGVNTTAVIDLLPGPGSALPADVREVPIDHAVIVGGWSGGADGAFFVADDGTHGQELWWSDGSVGGTRLLETFAGPRGGEPRHLTSLDGRAFFVADDGVHGRELWTSDGTAAGTRLVTDLVPGAGSSLPAWLTPVDGVLYFTAHRADVGTELWRTDGTAAGTELVQDVFPGPSPSSPENLTAAGRRLFFLANDGTHGFELWSMLLPTRVPRLTLTADGDFAPRGEVAFTLLLHNPAPEKLYDLVGDELYFLLPVEFRVLRVTADRGVAEYRRIGGLPDPEGTAVLPPPISIVDWNGSLEPGETLTLVIEAQLLGETAGQTYQLSARLAYDSDQDGDGDQRLRSDDPTLPGDMDVTEIVVAPQAIDVPAASEIGLVLLALLLAAAAVVRLRRRVA